VVRRVIKKEADSGEGALQSFSFEFVRRGGDETSTISGGEEE
jgi:hypothetical protein